MHRSKTFKIQNRTLIFLFLIFSFFEPMSIDVLEVKGSGASVWKIVGTMFLIFRVSISFGAILVFLLKLLQSKFQWSKMRFFLMMNICGWSISLFMNHTADLQSLIFVFQNFGFLLLCAMLADKSPKDLFMACQLLFGGLTLIGVISIFLFPMGFFYADITNNATYFLGGKNGSFPFYFFFMFSSIVLEFLWKKRKLNVYWYVIIMIAIIICQSANSFLCVGLFIAIVYLKRTNNKIMKKIDLNIVLLILAFIITMIYLGSTLKPVVVFLTKIGRDMKFSGRDVVWKQALDYIHESPLWGVGNNAKFTLRDLRNAVHAHSQYLHRMAVYGLVPFVFFVVSLMNLLHMGRKNNNKEIVNCILLLMSVYLLHMSFDTYVYYFVILLFILCETTFKRLNSGIAGNYIFQKINAEVVCK